MYLPMLISWTDLRMDKVAEVCSLLKLHSLQKSTVWTYKSNRPALFGGGRSILNTLHKALSDVWQKNKVSDVCVRACV